MIARLAPELRKVDPVARGLERGEGGERGKVREKNVGIKAPHRVYRCRIEDGIGDAVHSAQRIRGDAEVARDAAVEDVGDERERKARAERPGQRLQDRERDDHRRERRAQQRER